MLSGFQRHRFAFAATALCLAAAFTVRADVKALADRLSDIKNYTSQVRYEILQPDADEPVSYTITLTSADSPTDTLAPCKFLIEWALQRDGSDLQGFNCYVDGKIYRYRDRHLTHYAFETDSMIFLASGGLQNKLQFTDLLPVYIAERLRSMASDSTYILTFNDSACTISGAQTAFGCEGMRFTYEFDPQSKLPVKSEFIFNPGEMTEQTVTARYTQSSLMRAAPFDEKNLCEKYPELFDISNQQAGGNTAKLKNTLFPTFTYTRKRGSERLAHTRGQDDLQAPTLLVCFASGSTDRILNSVDTFRDALRKRNIRCNVIYIIDNDDVCENIVPSATEYFILHPESVMERNGLTAASTLVWLDKSGKVMDVVENFTEKSDDLSALFGAMQN